jgi:hypothetical protein
MAALADAVASPRDSAVLFGAAEAQWEASGANRYAPEQARYMAEVAGVRAKLSPEEFAEAWAEGRVMGRDRALAFALEITETCASEQ